MEYKELKDKLTIFHDYLLSVNNTKNQVKINELRIKKAESRNT